MKNVDKLLLIFCILSSLVSVVLLYSIYYNDILDSPKLAIVQAISAILGISLLVFFSNIDYKYIINTWKIHFGFSIFLVLLTFTPFAVQREGADDRAWLNLGIITIQPSEFLKISFIITLALHFNLVKNQINKLSNIIKLCIHGLIPVLIVVAQGDYGSALIFLFIFLSMFFCAGVSWKYIAFGISLFLIASPIVWFVLFDEHHRQRIKIIFDPFLDPLNFGFQQLQGRISLGSGRVTGKGLFAKDILNSIPEVYNDFIFSYVGQTLGLIGCLFVIFSLLFICFRILYIGCKSDDFVCKYICIGVFAMISFQSLINIGMVLNFIPVIGVTLPLFSAGGTSVITTYLAIGVIFSICNYNKSKLLFK